jgi:hypothetical protein
MSKKINIPLFWLFYSSSFPFSFHLQKQTWSVYICTSSFTFELSYHVVKLVSSFCEAVYRIVSLQLILCYCLLPYREWGNSIFHFLVSFKTQSFLHRYISSTYTVWAKLVCQNFTHKLFYSVDTFFHSSVNAITRCLPIEKKNTHMLYEYLNTNRVRTLARNI